MRNTYLIDFENVSSEGLAGVTSLTPEDRVIIFYSANSSRMTLRAHQQIVASTAETARKRRCRRLVSSCRIVRPNVRMPPPER